MDSELLNSMHAFWDILWQTTLCLGIGALFSWLWSNRPARAHCILVMSMIAAIVTPLLFLSIPHSGWSNSTASGSYNAEAEPRIYQVVYPDPNPASSSVAMVGSRESSGIARTAILFSKLFIVAYWLLASATMLLNLWLSYVGGRKLVGWATQVGNRPISQHAEIAMQKLGLQGRIKIRSSDAVRCPMIWCWGSKPVLLLPHPTSDSPSAVSWVSVLCHELAHWIRHDHLTTLAAEIVVALLPWHPLAWWCKRRLGLLSEQACDDWVLSVEDSKADYATTLVNLAEHPRPCTALAAVPNRQSLTVRIKNILRDRIRKPRLGFLWISCSMLLAGTMTATAVFAPTSPPESDPGTDIVCATRYALGNMFRFTAGSSANLKVDSPYLEKIPSSHRPGGLFQSQALPAELDLYLGNPDAVWYEKDYLSGLPTDYPANQRVVPSIPYKIRPGRNPMDASQFSLVLPRSVPPTDFFDLSTMQHPEGGQLSP